MKKQLLSLMLAAPVAAACQFTVQSGTFIYADSGSYIVASNDVNFNAGSTVTFRKSGFTTYANLASNGTVQATSGSLFIKGSSLQQLSGSMLFKNVTLDNPAGAQIQSGTGNLLSVIDTYQPTSGTLTTNGNLVIESADSITARVATGSNSGGYISGDVTIRRYIPARRAWRLLAAPFTSSNSIYNSWQNGGLYTAGMGMLVTAPSGTGIDAASNVSLKWHDVNTQSLINFTNTTVSLSDKPAYFAFVRGDRNTNNLVVPNTNNTTLEAKGLLYMGSQNVAVSGRPVLSTSHFTAVGNLYASSIDFSALGKTNVADRFFVWDPKLNAVGAYVLFDADNSYHPTVGGGSYAVGVANTVIESGQAFFVDASSTSNGTLTFNESAKVATQMNAFKTTSQTKKLNVQLLAEQAGGTFIPADGVTAIFDEKFSNAVDVADAGKLKNEQENLSLLRFNHQLAIEKRKDINSNDTLFLQLLQTSAKAYRFAIHPINFTTNETAFLEDSWLNSSTPLNLNAVNEIDFTISGNIASSNPNRFRIVFKQASTLPIQSIDISGMSKEQFNVINWTVSGEQNISHYELQRSTTGVEFNKVGIHAQPQNTSTATYTSTDVQPLKGDNFYRIKAVGNDGNEQFSKVINLKREAASPNIRFSSTIISGTALTVEFTNMVEGVYFCKLFNSLGQQVSSVSITHDKVTGSYRWSIPKSMSAGVYNAVVSHKNEQNSFRLLKR